MGLGWGVWPEQHYSKHLWQPFGYDVFPARFSSGCIHALALTFDEIQRGLLLGGAYAFDKGSYRRFYPLAKQEGLGVIDADFEKHTAGGIKFLEIQLKET